MARSRTSPRDVVEAAVETPDAIVPTERATAEASSSAVRRRIGPTPLDVFPIGLATPWFGSALDESGSAAVLDRFTELGGDLVMTSDAFARGRSEEVLGGWLRASGRRDGVVLGSRIGRGDEPVSTGPRAVVRAVEASLRRLGTDRLDLLSLVPTEAPLDDTLAAVDMLVTAGKVRAVAAIGFTPQKLFEARILVSHSLPAIVAVESTYNVLERDATEGDLALIVRSQGLSLLPFLPLAHGFLAGAVRSRRDARSTVRGPLAADHLSRHGLRALATIDRVADELDSTAAAVSLAWLLGREHVAAPVVSLGSIDQVDRVMCAPGVRLSRMHRSALDRIEG